MMRKRVEKWVQMIWIGLTGGMGSGKSTVAKILTKMGIPGVDADSLARLALEPQSESYQKVVNHFGSEILDAKGGIDRSALAKIVFQNPDQRRVLESLTHPFVQEKVREFRHREQLSGAALAFYDVPLLFEKQLQDQFDRVLLIASSRELQIQRVKERNKWNEQEIQSRLDSQMPMDEKVRLSSDVIWNNGSLRDLEIAVEAWVQNLKKSSSKA